MASSTRLLFTGVLGVATEPRLRLGVLGAFLGVLVTAWVGAGSAFSEEVASLETSVDASAAAAARVLGDLGDSSNKGASKTDETDESRRFLFGVFTGSTISASEEAGSAGSSISAPNETRLALLARVVWSDVVGSAALERRMAFRGGTPVGSGAIPATIGMGSSAGVSGSGKRSLVWRRVMAGAFL